MRWFWFLRSCFGMLWLWVVSAVMLSSCRTSSSSVATSRSDESTSHTAFVFLQDSVCVHDSVVIVQRADTFWQYRYRFRDRILRELRTDTIRDTIQLERTVTQQRDIVHYRIPRPVLWLLVALLLCSICPLIWLICRLRR